MTLLTALRRMKRDGETMEVRLAITATGKVAHLENPSASSHTVCGRLRSRWISVADGKELGLCDKCKNSALFRAADVEEQWHGPGEPEESYAEKAARVYGDPEQHWRDTMDVDAVVNNEHRELPEWMASSTLKVRHRREGPDSLVSSCGRLLDPADEEKARSTVLNLCGRCVQIQRGEMSRGEPWGGGELVMHVYAPGEATAELEAEVAGYAELARQRAAELRTARGEDGEQPAETIARLRRQNHEMGARFNRRLAAMQSELDGYRNVMREADDWVRRETAGATFKARPEVVRLLERVAELELEIGALKDRMYSAGRAERAAKEQERRWRAHVNDERNRLREAVQTALTRWEMHGEVGDLDELVDRIRAEIR